MQGKYFSFGATSAVITSLAVIVGLSRTANPVIGITTALHSGRSLSCRSAANPLCIIGAPKISIKTCKSEIKYHPLR
jgi:hypothetical protein